MTWEETVSALKDLARAAWPVDLHSGGITVQGAVSMVLGGEDGRPLTIETERSHWRAEVIEREIFGGA